MNVNDFITSVENLYESDVFIPNLIKVLDANRHAPVNRDLIGLPHEDIWYNADGAPVPVEEEAEENAEPKD